MRPRRLVLTNFGPYRGTAEVDFDRLGEVFLVCGKTGAGTRLNRNNESPYRPWR